MREMERAEAPTWVTFKSVISPLIIITSGAYVQTDRDRPGERAAWLVEGSEIDRWRVVERGYERGKKKNEIWWAEGCCWAFVRGRLKFIQSNQLLNLTLSARPLFCSHTHTHTHTHTLPPCPIIVHSKEWIQQCSNYERDLTEIMLGLHMSWPRLIQFISHVHCRLLYAVSAFLHLT